MIKSKNLIIILISFLLCFAFTGCDKLIGNPEGGYNILISGVVTDESNNPVSGVRVSSGYGTTVTNNLGAFYIIGYYFMEDGNIDTVSVPLSFEKNGNKTENVEIKLNLYVTATTNIKQKTDGSFEISTSE